MNIIIDCAVYSLSTLCLQPIHVQPTRAGVIFLIGENLNILLGDFNFPAISERVVEQIDLGHNNMLLNVLVMPYYCI